MSKWPADNQAALLKFYGTPGPEVERQLVPVVPPFKMYYEGKLIKSIRFHRKAAGALAAALQEIWDHYKHDQATIDKLGISKYAGAYNPRFIRGSSTKWSNHAYGAAVDLNAEDNGFGKGKGTIPQPVIDAFKRQGARWGGDYKGRTDPMHFEFCYNGQPDQQLGLFEPPETDADQGENDDGETSDPVTEAPKTGWLKSSWSKVVEWKKTAMGGGGVGLGALIYDYRVAIALVSTVLIIFLIVWFTYLRKKLEKDG